MGGHNPNHTFYVQNKSFFLLDLRLFVCVRLGSIIFTTRYRVDG